MVLEDRLLAWQLRRGSDQALCRIYQKYQQRSFRNHDPVDSMATFVRYLLDNRCYKKLGKAVFEGHRCFGIEFLVGGLLDKDGTNRVEWVQRLWIDVETKLPVRQEKRRRTAAGEPDMTYPVTINDQYNYNPLLPADTFVPKIPEGFTWCHPDEIERQSGQ